MTRVPAFESARGLSRVEAARYVGVSPGTFDRLVEDGVMPKPKRIRARLIFDRFEVDVAFDAIGEAPARTNDFDAAR